MRWRDAYRQALDPEALLDTSWIAALRSGTGSAACPGGEAADATAAQAAAWARDAAGEFDGLGCDGDGGHLVRELLAQSAPMASVLGAWLQGMSAPGVFEDPVQMRIMALLADDVGAGRANSSRWSQFGLLLHRHGLTGLAEPAHLAASQAIDDAAFALPAALLAMSRRADVLAAQIAGVDLVLRRIGLLPAWAHQRSNDPEAIAWSRLDLGQATWVSSLDPVALAAATARDYADLSPDRHREVAEGAAWALSAVRRWHENLLASCRAALDPERAMAALLQRRAREGSVYHGAVQLEGRTLSEWLQAAKTDPRPLLEVLRSSRLIRPGDSAHSPLSTGLVSSRGPMFRVFSPDDLSIIERWIDALPARGSAPSPASAPRNVGVVPAAYAAAPERHGAAEHDDGVAPHDLREAYHLLQGRSIPAATRTFALRYARKWLADAAHSLDRTERSLPRTWPAEGLRPWLLEQHDRHGDEFETGKGTTIPSREAVIDSTLQLAPLTLIDGAWLQGFTDVRLASSRVGSPLFHTYWDELGNGEPELNHPRIYRHVLREMGVTLPPTGSQEFARDPRLREDSFRLPVYWLCLGKLPDTLQPEILGLNLAMELSGVGGSYRQARAVLAHYGFDTLFVDIHNTIDNVSTGHSAWAADAVDEYMRTVTDSVAGDRTRAAEEWQRVRTGYESLKPLPRPGLRRTRFRFASARRGAGPARSGSAPRHHIAVGSPA